MAEGLPSPLAIGCLDEPGEPGSIHGAPGDESLPAGLAIGSVPVRVRPGKLMMWPPAAVR